MSNYTSTLNSYQSAQSRPSSDQINQRYAVMGKGLRHIGAWIVQFLTCNEEPRISHRGHGQNQTWRVYDPIQAQAFEFASERDVRVWLEGRY
jgi:hypothetical protein